MSRSPADVQPVFDAIAHSALNLCDASFTVVLRYDGVLLHMAAQAQGTTEALDAMRQLFPMRPDRRSIGGRAILDGVPVHVPDIESDPEYAAGLRTTLHTASAVSVPMLRNGQAIGAISIGHVQPRHFSERQIALLQTFADQAVIAIENVRLFHELQASNRGLAESLEKQTATAEILRVISMSPTDTAPVFDTIVRNAARLCRASSSSIYLLDGDWLVIAASHNVPPELPTRVSLTVTPNAARVIREGVIHHIADLDAETEARVTPGARRYMHAIGARASLQVPLRRGATPLGSLAVYRPQPGAFADAEIALLETFADQAVIAIENARLLGELQGPRRAERNARSASSPRWARWARR